MLACLEFFFCFFFDQGIGSQITTTTVASAGYAMIMTRERCLLVLEFFFCFLFDQGIGSRSAAWASRVDVV